MRIILERILTDPSNKFLLEFSLKCTISYPKDFSTTEQVLLKRYLEKAGGNGKHKISERMEKNS